MFLSIKTNKKSKRSNCATKTLPDMQLTVAFAQLLGVLLIIFACSFDSVDAGRVRQRKPDTNVRQTNRGMITANGGGILEGQPRQSYQEDEYDYEDEEEEDEAEEELQNALNELSTPADAAEDNDGDNVDGDNDGGDEEDEERYLFKPSLK